MFSLSYFINQPMEENKNVAWHVCSLFWFIRFYIFGCKQVDDRLIVDFWNKMLCYQAVVIPMRSCLDTQMRFPKEVDGGRAGGAQGRLALKLSHFLLLRPWVLPALGSSIRWICRSFHGPLILKWVCGQGKGRWQNTGLSKGTRRAVNNV